MHLTCRTLCCATYHWRVIVQESHPSCGTYARCCSKVPNVRDSYLGGDGDKAMYGNYLYGIIYTVHWYCTDVYYTVLYTPTPSQHECTRHKCKIRGQRVVSRSFCGRTCTLEGIHESLHFCLQRCFAPGHVFVPDASQFQPCFICQRIPAMPHPTWITMPSAFLFLPVPLLHVTAF